MLLLTRFFGDLENLFNIDKREIVECHKIFLTPHFTMERGKAIFLNCFKIIFLQVLQDFVQIYRINCGSFAYKYIHNRTICSMTYIYKAQRYNTVHTTIVIEDIVMTQPKIRQKFGNLELNAFFAKIFCYWLLLPYNTAIKLDMIVQIAKCVLNQRHCFTSALAVNS